MAKIQPTVDNDTERVRSAEIKSLVICNYYICHKSGK